MIHFQKTAACGAMAAGALFLAAAPAAGQESGNWSGFYAGVEGGGVRERLSVRATDLVTQYTNINPPGAEPLTIVPGTVASFAARGRDTSLLYGGVAGFQFESGRAVFGIEGDVRAGGASVVAASTVQLPLTILASASTLSLGREAKTRYQWSLRTRLGYDAGSTLFYATGGLAGAHVRLRADNSYTIPAGNAGNPLQPFPAQGPFLVTARETRDLLGWTAGIGVEQRVGPHLRLGLEARYSDYGSKTFDLANAAQTNAGTPAPAPFTAISGEGAYPGPTRVRLTAAQIAVRATFAF